MRKNPTLKYRGKIDPSERIYYHFKLDAARYMIYDSEMGEPVEFGSFNKVGAAISKLPTDCTIFYFELNGTQGWKMKRAYKPDKSTAEMKDKSDKIQEKKEESQEDKKTTK